MNITQLILTSQVFLPKYILFYFIKLTICPIFSIIKSYSNDDIILYLNGSILIMSDNNSSSNNIHKKTVFIFDADDGMTLSKDVLNSDGSLIAASGTKLDMDMIAKISANHILEIEIIDKDYTEPVRPVENDNSTYYEKVRNSKEFKAFCKEYNEGISDLKSQLNDIVNRNADVDVDELLTYPLSLMNTYSNKLQMFDMLHSLRQFDDLTYAHSVNVALVASIIGEWLGYSEEDVHVLTLCGLLHDIGKVRIPRKILEKPGKLTPTEFEVMKAHVNEGYDIIKDKDIDSRVKEACLLHHEKCDGTGYPFGLTSDKIPDFAKIIAIADIYDAMTSDRVYRSAVCPFTVIHLMEQECFSTLDPKFALPFFKNVASSYIHNNVKLSNGETGEVVLINDRSLSRPVIRCKDKFIDLSAAPDLTITAIL